MKTKEKEIQVDLYSIDELQVWKEDQWVKYSKYLLSKHGRFQISKMNSRVSLFEVEGSDIGHNLPFYFCNSLILVFFI